MKTRESVEIIGTLEQVWAFLADPATWPAWNRKLVHLRRNRNGPVVIGEQFGATFQMKRRVEDSQIEVTACEPPTRLVFRQSFEHRLRRHRLEVAFAVAPTPQGVRFTQVLDWSESGIPWPLRLLIWCIHRFGRPVGTCSLQKLKELVEKEQ